MKIETYSVSEPIDGICKQYAVWIQNGYKTSPLIYLQKPKWVNDDQWREIAESIRLDLQKGYEVEEK